MKKLLFLCSFLLVAGMTQAQSKSCSNTCAKTCTKAEKTAALEDVAPTQVASALAEAEVAAQADESIEKRVCADSGKVSFFQKNTCEKSGRVSFDEVSYCTESKKFSSVASASLESDVEEVPVMDGEAPAKASKKACSKDGGKACCAKKKAKTE